MATVLKLTYLVVVCMVVVAPMAADAALSCRPVIGKFAPCSRYLAQGGAIPPACCFSVRGLNSVARTTPDRQKACLCLQYAARAMGTLKAGRAAALPRLCAVKIPLLNCVK